MKTNQVVFAFINLSIRHYTTSTRKERQQTNCSLFSDKPVNYGN